MLNVFPIAAFVLLAVLARRASEGVRAALIAAAIVWGLLTTAIVETLSVAHAVTPTALAAAWVLVTIICIAALLRTGVRVVDLAPSFRDALKAGVKHDVAYGELALFIGICLLMVLVACAALLCPPNTWDVVQFHLPRVVLWLSNRSVETFPTPDLVQIIQTPFAEFAVMTFHALCGSDRLDAIPQLASFVGTSLAASLIAAELGASLRGQLFAALVSATLPSAILTSSGVKNDEVVAFWVASATFQLLRLARRPSWPLSILAGGALGLAALTKGTAYFYLPPFALAALWLGRNKLSRILPRLVASGLLALTVNMPHYARMYAFSGSFVGPATFDGRQDHAYGVAHVSAGGTVLNVMRNLSLDAVTPWASINSGVERAVRGTAGLLRLDPDDPNTTYGATSSAGGYRLQPWARHEILSSNPQHLALLVLTVILLVRARRRLTSVWVVGALALASGFVLSSAFLRWQLFGTRFQIPFFVVSAGLAGLALGTLPRRVALLLGALFVGLALPAALFNQLRPLVARRGKPTVFSEGRADLYFRDSHARLAASYESAASALLETTCRRVGIDASLEHYEYPAMALIDGGLGRTIEYTAIWNESSKYRRSDTQGVCAVLCFDCANVPAKWARYRTVGGRASVFGSTALFGDFGIRPNNAVAGVSDASTAAAQLEFAVASVRALDPISIWKKMDLVPPSRRSALIETAFEVAETGSAAEKAWDLSTAARERAHSGNGSPADVQELLELAQANKNGQERIEADLATFEAAERP